MEKTFENISETEEDVGEVRPVRGPRSTVPPPAQGPQQSDAVHGRVEYCEYALYLIWVALVQDRIFWLMIRIDKENVHAN